MNTKKRSNRRIKGYVACIGALALILVAVAIKWHSHALAEHDRVLQKEPAIALCQDAIGKEVSQLLRYTDLSASDQAAITASARFTDMSGTPELLSADNYGVPGSLGKPRSSVLTNWQIGGRVSLEGKLPFVSGLGEENRLACSVVVFDDGTIYVGSTQVLR
ncbi:hypothetical protein [Mycobacteroides franklinii]|uniref:hypothetical protein n=1 Tax=Mycobacteroides franklinii TaxID=948102 RepID=UPI00104212A4|nr:hypothetical protein [Mycobacteroides franklinii]